MAIAWPQGSGAAPSAAPRLGVGDLAERIAAHYVVFFVESILGGSEAGGSVDYEVHSKSEWQKLVAPALIVGGGMAVGRGIRNAGALNRLLGEDGSVLNLGRWNKGSHDSAEESLLYHFDKHGPEFGASTAAQYLRKAEGFARNLRGATRNRSPIEGTVEGVVRCSKNGRYIDLAPDGSIISFEAR